ncbi:uncharacterized protein LOC108738904 [Agrilus planipennis]|uniref:Uncharacterized protein LOC108738904 n=1 Tax=Agrilus planipennis TaxID=224129 RepID=A0A1W4WVZ0_AGRPL|nr:uncharacterized protein LOC108738904 [Agrilus planipennis]
MDKGFQTYYPYYPPCNTTQRGSREFYPFCSRREAKKADYVLEESASVELNSVILNETVYDEVQRGALLHPIRKLRKRFSIPPTQSPMYLDDLMKDLLRFEGVCKKKKKKKKKVPGPSCKLSYLKNMKKMDRDVLTRKQYIDFLSTPKKYPKEDPCPKPPDPCKILKTEMCPPRILQLAIPKKRLVYETWKNYNCVLPIHLIEKLQEILHSDRNLEASYARRYFKRLERQKKRKKMLEKKRRLRQIARRKDKWLKDIIKRTAKAIVKFIRDRPNYSLNYKQIMFSDALYNLAIQIMPIPRLNRNCPCNAYHRTLLEILDKIAMWVDLILKYIDIHYTDSEEELLLRLPSAGELGEGEEEGEGEGEEEEELSELSELSYGEGEGDISILELQTELTITESDKGDDLLDEGEGEEGFAGFCADTEDVMGMLKDSMLGLLISIYERGPTLLEEQLDPKIFGKVTRRYLLDKIKSLADKDLADLIRERQVQLEQRMMEWVHKNAPEELNDDMCKTIKIVAALLARCFGKEFLAGLLEEELLFGTGEDDDGAGRGRARLAGDEGRGGGVQEYGEEGLAGDDLFGDDRSKGYDDGKGEGEEEECELPDMDEGEGPCGEGEFGFRGVCEEGEDEEGGRRRRGKRPCGEEGEESEESEEGVCEGEGGKKKKKPCELEIERRRREHPLPTTICAHKPSKTFEHSPDMMCCLHLKLWATWLYEVANNAHTWTKWIIQVSQEVRHYAAIVRGDVLDDNGKPKVLYKQEWRDFVAKIDKMIVSWRQYSLDVKKVTESVIKNFKGKKVQCCPKCLEDSNIVDVSMVHGITQQLADAMMTAQYWRNWLDDIMMQTCKLLTVDVPDVCDTDSVYTGMMSTITEIGSYISDGSDSVWEIEEMEKGKCVCFKDQKK